MSKDEPGFETNFRFFLYLFLSHLLLSHNALNLTYLSVQISCFDIPFTYGQKVLKIYEKRKPSFFYAVKDKEGRYLKKDWVWSIFSDIFLYF